MNIKYCLKVLIAIVINCLFLNEALTQNNQLKLNFDKFLEAENREIKIKILAVGSESPVSISQKVMDDDSRTLLTCFFYTKCSVMTAAIAEKLSKYEFVALKKWNNIDLRYKFEFIANGETVMTFYANRVGFIQFKGDNTIYKQKGKEKNWLLEFWEGRILHFYLKGP
ncbi:MAG: hypothetical protein GYA35_03830 [Thermoanaerobaculaceae bacterium]|nr:hypothetical protein [Thermoanaerobaculaceae bacterium]